MRLSEKAKRDVENLIREGRDDREIAQLCKLTPATVSKHRGRLASANATTDFYAWVATGISRGFFTRLEREGK